MTNVFHFEQNDLELCPKLDQLPDKWARISDSSKRYQRAWRRYSEWCSSHKTSGLPLQSAPDTSSRKFLVDEYFAYRQTKAEQKGTGTTGFPTDRTAIMDVYEAYTGPHACPVRPRSI